MAVAITPSDPDHVRRIAEAVRTIRASRGLTQQELAEKAAISLRTLTHIETGTRRARDWAYGRVAIALDVPLSEIMDGGAE